MLVVYVGLGVLGLRVKELKRSRVQGVGGLRRIWGLRLRVKDFNPHTQAPYHSNPEALSLNA